MSEVAYRFMVGFFGAAAGLKVARFGFGATGTGAPETIAMVGFVASFGLYVLLRLKNGVPANG